MVIFIPYYSQQKFTVNDLILCDKQEIQCPSMLCVMPQRYETCLINTLKAIIFNTLQFVNETQRIFTHQ